MNVMSNRKRPVPDAPGGSMGELISELHSEGHVNPRQFRAVVALLSDLRAYHGDSGGLVGYPTEKVQTGASERIWPPGGPPGIVELGNRLNRLRPHERHLMRRLVVGKEMARGTLADLGRLSSGYKTAKTRKAVAVGRICAFLDTLVEIYDGRA